MVIALGRGKRPGDFAKKREPYAPLTGECPFCFPEETGQEKDALIYRRADGDWSLRVFPNKFPAFSRAKAAKHFEEGPYFGMDGVGYHELIVTRDHTRQIALLDPVEVAEIMDAYQSRYIDLMSKKSVNYIEIFHNHGREAGASIEHPHSQLMAIPVVSPGVQMELDGAEIYHKSNRKCVYCAIADWEIESKKRLIFENDNFLAFCPYSSRAAFEVWVMPKAHKPYFERINNEEKIDLGEALQKSIGAIYKTLKTRLTISISTLRHVMEKTTLTITGISKFCLTRRLGRDSNFPPALKFPRSNRKERRKNYEKYLISVF